MIIVEIKNIDILKPGTYVRTLIVVCGSHTAQKTDKF